MLSTPTACWCRIGINIEKSAKAFKKFAFLNLRREVETEEPEEDESDEEDDDDAFENDLRLKLL